MSTCFIEAGGSIDLYFYGELDPEARARVESHLSGCAECRRALAELQLIRSALQTRPQVSSPPGGDWTAFMTRLQVAVASARKDDETPEMGRESAHRAIRSRYAMYVAMAALLALVTLSVAHAVRSRTAATGRSPVVSEDVRPAPAAWSKDAAFASLAEQHFERSKLVVLGLVNKNTSDRAGASDWEYERALAASLLADTRLYRLAAEDRGMKELARTMGDLELVLLQASLSGDPQPDTLAQIQRLIRKRDLVTRMNVMASAGM
jgi:hypothetical protein